MLGALYVLVINAAKIPGLLFIIFHDAFTGTAAIGGIAGIAFKDVVIQGVRRACFSNEAGLGSAPMIHGAAKTKEPIREGAVAMIGPFIDTIVICTMTALVILITGAWTQDLNGITLAVFAFDSALEGFGKYFVSIGVFLFAFSTMISWSYYGEKCSEYLFGEKSILTFKAVFVTFTFIGAVWELGAVLDFSDAMAGLMAIPNLIGMTFLARKVVTASADYFSRMKSASISQGNKAMEHK
jgi:AGCS family alanine or glycine:cation symporter